MLDSPVATNIWCMDSSKTPQWEPHTQFAQRLRNKRVANYKILKIEMSWRNATALFLQPLISLRQLDGRSESSNCWIPMILYVTTIYCVCIQQTIHGCWVFKSRTNQSQTTAYCSSLTTEKRKSTKFQWPTVCLDVSYEDNNQIFID